MGKFKAKPVIEDEYWILQEDDVKVGQLKMLPGDRVEVKLTGKGVREFSSLQEVKESGLIEFATIPNPRQDSSKIYGYPTAGEVHDPVWDLQYGLPLYTKKENSKSRFAAGYYKIKAGKNFIVKFCPKLIQLLRNEFEGPFKSDPAHSQFGTLFDDSH